MRQKSGDQGFTILEILLAVVILTVGLLGLLAVFPVAMRSGKQAVDHQCRDYHSIGRAGDSRRPEGTQAPERRWEVDLFHLQS